MSTPTLTPVPSKENTPRSRAITRLKPERVEAGLRKLPNWRRSRDGRSLVRTFKFAAERAPLAFTELVLALAAKEGHSRKRAWKSGCKKRTRKKSCHRQNAVLTGG